MHTDSFNTFVILPAAGSGSRLGLGRSKGLMMLAGKTAIERVLEAAASVCPQAAFVIMAPAAEVEQFQQLSFGDLRVRVLPGGKTRQESVRAGLEWIEASGNPAKGAIVLVHDAARCLVQPALIQSAIEGAREWGAVTAVLPLVDSVVQLDSEGSARALPRAALRAVQTPQAFQFELLLRAHRSGRDDATDDASLVENLHPVKVIAGDSENFKITTADDILRAEAILTARVRAV